MSQFPFEILIYKYFLVHTYIGAIFLAEAGGHIVWKRVNSKQQQITSNKDIESKP
jgi:hypothetical protein